MNSNEWCLVMMGRGRRLAERGMGLDAACSRALLWAMVVALNPPPLPVVMNEVPHFRWWW